MRLESVEVLQRVVVERLKRVQGKGLEKADVLFVLEAMGIVASHPISSFDTEQNEAGRRRRRAVWEDMERKLSAMAEGAEEESAAVLARSTFYTPY